MFKISFVQNFSDGYIAIINIMFSSRKENGTVKMKLRKKTNDGEKVVFGGSLQHLDYIKLYCNGQFFY